MKVACKELNIQPSEFWQMPFFVIHNAVKGLNGDKKEMNRAEVLDAIRSRKKRFNWS